MIVALIQQVRREGAQHRQQARDRVAGELRVGDVALDAGESELGVQTAAAADLDHLAEFSRIGRLTHQAVVDDFAVCAHPVQHLDRAIDRDAFLIAGNQQADRARHLAAARRQELRESFDETRDGAFHVRRTAAKERIVDDLAGERILRPGVTLADRHHVGMAGVAKVGCRRAEPGIEIVDFRLAFGGEPQAVAGKPEGGQRAFEDVERALVARRHAFAANQLLRQR